MIYYTYLAVLGIAFVCSLYHFRLHALHLKLLAILLGIALVTECCAMPLLHFFHLRNNNYFYNTYLLIEGLAWMYYYYLLDGKRRRLWVRVAAAVYMVCWVISTFFIFGFGNWNSYLAVLESLLAVCLAAAYYYRLFTSERLISLRTHPEFWIATGMLLYYSCNLPYLGMLDYLVKNYAALSKVLLILLEVLNMVMYSFFTYAFLCRTDTTKY